MTFCNIFLNKGIDLVCLFKYMLVDNNPVATDAERLEGDTGII